MQVMGLLVAFDWFDLRPGRQDKLRLDEVNAPSRAAHFKLS